MIKHLTAEQARTFLTTEVEIGEPWLFKDEVGNLVMSLPVILKAVGVEDTPENRAVVVEEFKKLSVGMDMPIVEWL